jgi:hypothetical protein
VKLEGTIHCEGPECNTHAHVGSGTVEAGRLPIGFLRVIEYGGSSDPEFAFCSCDCLMKWAAQVPPPEVIPWGAPDEA